MTHQPVNTKSARRIAGSILAATVLITACESRLPTSAEVEQMDVGSIEQKVTEARLLATTEPLYVVDGKSVDAPTAKALKASDISSMSVTKTGNGSPGEIRIATVSGVPVGLVPTLREKAVTEKMRSRVALTQTSASSAFTGLLIIDGIVATPSTLNTLSPDRILSMEVVKSAAATRKYNDPRAANGVIVVTTKK